MRIGILQTDHVRPQFVTRHGDYEDMFASLLRSEAPDLDLVVYDVQKAIPETIDCDAYLITGSKDSVYDDLPWIMQLVDFVKASLAAGKKVIGVCFGHQLMAHFFGGRVAAADKGWGVGVHTSDVCHQYPWMADLPAQQLSLLSSHKDQVMELPHGAQLYLASDFCPLAGFVQGSQVLTVQGHPEFSAQYAADLMDMRAEILGEPVYQAGKKSLSRPTQSALMAKWMLSFIAADECE
jgi:GMP synthase-like glutamine amidotransferase